MQLFVKETNSNILRFRTKISHDDCENYNRYNSKRIPGESNRPRGRTEISGRSCTN